MEYKGIVNIVKQEKQQVESIGTGFFVTHNLILTCYHVAHDASAFSTDVKYKFENSEVIYNSRVKDSDIDIDIVLLETDEYHEDVLELDRNLRLNKTCNTSGFPKGSMVMSPSRPVIKELIANDTKIKLDKANDITGGFSGAPLIGENGKVLGVIVSTPERLRQSGSMLEIAHAVPVSKIVESFAMIRDMCCDYPEISYAEKREFIIQYLTNLKEGCEQKLKQIHSGVYPLSGDVYSREVSKHYGAEDMDLRLDYETFDETGEKKSREDDICKCINSTSKKVVLLGEPGCGKSVSLLKLTLEFANKAIEDDEELIPILVPLGSYKDDIPPIEYVKKRMAKDTNAINAIFEPEHCLFIFDALNEVASSKRSNIVTYILGLSRYIVSCRLLDYKQEFQKQKDILRIEILELNLLQIKDAITKKISLQNRGNLWEALGGNDKLILFWENMCKEGKESEFWESPNAIPHNDYLTIKEETTIYELDAWENMHAKGLIPLCRNPMLLRMVYDLYLKNRTNLPENRGQLFEQFTNECLDSEIKKIRQKEEKSSEELVVLKKRTLEMLTLIAQSIISNKQGTGISYSDGYELLIKEFDAKEIEEIEKFAHDASILLVDTDEYRFIHQLHQEYFASRYLSSVFENGGSSSAFFSSPIWWETTGWEESAVLLAGIFKESKRNEFLVWLADSQPQLVIRCIEKSGISGLSTYSLNLNTKAILQEKWISRIESMVENEESRIYIGRALDRIGDSRLGVGTMKMGNDDYPEFDWILDSENSLYVSKYPVTVKQFKSFLTAYDGYFSDENWDISIESQEWHHMHLIKHDLPSLGNSPMVNVSWYEAVAFCKWLQKRMQGNIRLPREEEWIHFVKACRICMSDFQDSDLRDLDENDKYVSVGLTQNQQGGIGYISDIGLVWEWCGELFGNMPAELGVINPKSIPTCILKGGSWRYNGDYTVVEYRNRTYASSSGVDIGFRVVKEVDKAVSVC